MAELNLDAGKVDSIVKGNRSADDNLEAIEAALDPHLAIRPFFVKARGILQEIGVGEGNEPWGTSELVDNNDKAFDHEVCDTVEELRNDIRGQIHSLESATNQMQDWKNQLQGEDANSAELTSTVDLGDTSFATKVGRNDIAWDPSTKVNTFVSDDYIKAEAAAKNGEPGPAAERTETKQSPPPEKK